MTRAPRPRSESRLAANTPRPTREPRKFQSLSQFTAKYWLPLLLLVMIGALALRASDLKADPPPDLSWSTGPYTDAGLDTYSARNLVLYGHWRIDDFFPLVIYPLVNYISVLIFKLLGIGFVQLKLLSLLASLASVLVIFLMMKEDCGHLTGLLAGLALATSYPLAMYGRLGLVETVQILFLLLTGLFYVRGLKRPRQMGLAGLFGASSILLVKVSAAFVAPAMIAAVIWELLLARKDRNALRTILRGVGWGTAGASIALVIWLVAVLIPYRASYFQYVLRHSLASPLGHPRGVVDYVTNTFSVGLVSGLMARIAWPAAIGFVTLPLLATSRKPVFRFLGLWFLLALLMLGVMNYRPDRYELVLLPVLFASFAATLAGLLEEGTILPRLQPSIPKTILYSLWIWPLATQTVVYTNHLWGLVRKASDLTVITYSLLLAFVTGFAGYAIVRLSRQGVHLGPIAARIVVAALLVTLTLRLDLKQYFGWFRHRTHDMVACSKDMETILPEGAVMAGAWAPELLAGSRKRALAITDWANTRDPIGEYGVTHVVSREGGLEEELFWKLYPELMKKPKNYWRGKVGDIVLVIYELPKTDEQLPVPNTLP